MKSYTVHYERDRSGWWIVTIPAVQGCRTQGRSIAEGRKRIREALALFIDDAAAGRAEFVDHVKLPAATRKTVRQVAEARRKAERQQAEALKTTRAAATELTRRAGLSVRDVAEMLGISYQRVQQLSGARR
jgi:predicted RNase H-like HicB family nuclease